MKKIITLSAISIITLSSFNLKNENKDEINDKTTVLTKYWFHCKDGSMSGSFTIDGSMSDAQSLANSLCS